MPVYNVTKKPQVIFSNLKNIEYWHTASNLNRHRIQTIIVDLLSRKGFFYMTNFKNQPLLQVWLYTLFCIKCEKETTNNSNLKYTEYWNT